MELVMITPLGLMALGAALGGVSVYILMALKINRIERAAAEIGGVKTALDLLRARVRGIQGHGKDTGKGEVMYNIQSANGKFAKMTLPKV